MAFKRRRKVKEASRIPGVPVGDEVNTSIGKKKKVCFNIGGICAQPSRTKLLG